MAERIALAVAVLALTACGPNVAPPAIGVSSPDRSFDGGVVRDGGDAGVVDALPTFDAIAERASPIVRGMHEAARAEIAAPSAADLARADARDVCARVAFAASANVTARIVDDKGAVLAERAGETEGLLAARGPVCVRRGGAMRVTFDAPAGARVRFIAWIAP